MMSFMGDRGHLNALGVIVNNMSSLAPTFVNEPEVGLTFIPMASMRGTNRKSELISHYYLTTYYCIVVE